MYLFHNYKDTVSVLDSEGRSYHIPPNTPWEVPAMSGTDIPGPAGQPAYKSFTIPANKFADILINQAPHLGLVKVMEVRTSAGITFDVDGAAKASTVKRTQAEDLMLQTYVKAAKEDELGKQPVRPPSDPIRRILDARGLDLKRDFGIQPVGYTVSDGAKQRDAQIAALEAQNQAQAKELSEMKEMLTMILEERTSKKPKAS